MDKHTKTPWLVGLRSAAGLYPVAGGENADGDYTVVADAGAHADAAFIVRACNAHDDLVTACQGLLQFVRERYPDDFKEGGRGFICPHHIAIEAALKPIQP